MKVSVEKLPSSEAVLEIDLSWDELEKASDKAYRKLVQKVDVQGFRRGKAPRSLLERRLGKEYIYQEGLDELISEAYRNALKEHELTPLTQPELEAPVFEMGQPYHFSIKVPIVTPVTLGDYRSLHFEREDADVTSEEVEQELESLRNGQTTWHEVERPAEYNDRVTVDLKLVVEDKTISDLKDNPFELTQERHGLFKGMDEHVVGMQAGESKEFTTTIPADYTNTNLASKEAQYTLKLYKIEVKEVPELDDAFAQKVSNGQYQTVEDVRKAISDQILENKKRRISNELREKIINAIAEQSQFSIHSLLIKEETEEMVHQLTHVLEQQHMTLDQYLMLMRKTREEYLKELEPEAEKRVKEQLVLDAVVKAEEITVLPEELESLLQVYAQQGQPLGRSEAELRYLLINYRREKAARRLLDLTTDPDPDAELTVEEEANVIDETPLVPETVMTATDVEQVTPVATEETTTEPGVGVQAEAFSEAESSEVQAQ